MNWGDSGCLYTILDKDGNATGQIAQITCIFPLFQNIINAALGLAGVVALFFIIYAGIKFLTSGGDAKKVGNAKSTLTWAIIGILVIFFSFAIVNFLSKITGVNCINNKFGFEQCIKK